MKKLSNTKTSFGHRCTVVHADMAPYDLRIYDGTSYNNKYDVIFLKLPLKMASFGEAL